MDRLASTAQYRTDYHKWAFETADALRAGRISEVDLAGVADEIEDLGRAERHKLTNFLVVLITHVLKWEHQPDERSKSWIRSIRESQKRLELVLADNPSLKTRQTEAIRDAYSIALTIASSETGLAEDIFPSGCPYAWNDLLEYKPE